MYKKALILLLIAAYALSNPAKADEDRCYFSRENLRETKRLVYKRITEGNWETVCTPAAALSLFPQLVHELNSIRRKMEKSRKLRVNPATVHDVLNSYELDMMYRNEFNMTLEELGQCAGDWEEWFSEEGNKASEWRQDLIAEKAAFEEARRIIDDDISPVALDPLVDNLTIDWPKDLPEDAAVALEIQLERLLAADYYERRVAEWRHLDRVYEYLRKNFEAAMDQTLGDLELRSKLLKIGVAEIFQDVKHMITDCVQRNKEANERSSRLRAFAADKIHSKSR